MSSFEQVFCQDAISKRERVERTLRHEPVDRVALHDQLSYNPAVLSLYAGREITGFEYGVDEIAQAVRRTLDMCFRPRAPLGTERHTTEDGFVVQNDNWTRWHVSRPFDTVAGALEWLRRQTRATEQAPFEPERERSRYRDDVLRLQVLIGETVLLDYGDVGLAGCFDAMGLELFTYVYADEPLAVAEYLAVKAAQAERVARAVADPALAPAYLIADDFASKGGPIFSPSFLRREFFPLVRRVVQAWHNAGLHVLYHSDGNYKLVIPDLIELGVDGFYCLEPALGMDVVELKQRWPGSVWAGGVDGVDLMERGTPEEVAKAVRRQIEVTGALCSGGLFVGSSSEINPPIKPENYVAMVDAVGQCWNPGFALSPPDGETDVSAHGSAPAASLL